MDGEGHGCTRTAGDRKGRRRLTRGRLGSKRPGVTSRSTSTPCSSMFTQRNRTSHRPMSTVMPGLSINESSSEVNFPRSTVFLKSTGRASLKTFAAQGFDDPRLRVPSRAGARHREGDVLQNVVELAPSSEVSRDGPSQRAVAQWTILVVSRVQVVLRG